MAPYIPSGVAYVAALPAVASLAAPTSLEIAAGVILTQPNHSVVSRIMEMNGWETDAGTVNAGRCIGTQSRTDSRPTSPG